MIQDIVVGSPNPTSEMKQDEFNREINLSKVSYDTFVCPYSSYAIMHLYLQDFDDKRILSFCNQGIQFLKKEEEILNDNISAIVNYQPTNKDLKLVWEVSNKSNVIINFFRNYRVYGLEEEIKGKIDGLPFSLYVLTIANENVKSFQRDVQERFSNPGDYER